MLYLASDDDNITLGSITSLKKFYPKETAHRFESGKNHVHLLFADQYIEAIKEFLNGVQLTETTQE
jgi:hypothetical protein